jgi:hypothetical protein
MIMLMSQWHLFVTLHLYHYKLINIASNVLLDMPKDDERERPIDSDTCYSEMMRHIIHRIFFIASLFHREKKCLFSNIGTKAQ